MREATYQEYQSALLRVKFGAMETRRMITKRTQDLYHSDCGTEVASCHIGYTRGKETSCTYRVNPAYLKETK